MCRPNITLIGEQLNLNLSVSKRTKFDYVLVIGTTLQFPYLRKIISNAKQKGAKIVHVNPDECYNDKYEVKNPYLDQYRKPKMDSNVRKKEIWICKNSYEGLVQFNESF